MTAPVTRRGFLGGMGALGAGLAVGGAATGLAGCADDRGTTAGEAVPFHGEHQAGIATPAQDRLACAAFDLTTRSRADLRDLLREWTGAAAAMTAGRPVPGDSTTPALPPADTGEAMGVPPARLTVTVGFGPALFDDRFGLASRRPAALADLPRFPGDEVERGRSGGDICVQACADDPVVAFHAVRNLARLARGTAVIRWSQLGFGRTSSTTSSQATPRNLMGFKDGTRNIKSDNAAEMSRHVWVGGDTDQSWLRGGTFLVTRRIRMLIEAWDRDFLQDQEQVFGRHKVSGAPLGGRHEFDTPDLAAARGGRPVIPADAHIRLASPETNAGTRILRRGYSYTDGIDPRTGQLDAGLFFIAFQRDPQQFVRLQQRLSAHDALNEYVRPTSSGLYACPPGVRPGGFWGEALLAA